MYNQMFQPQNQMYQPRIQNGITWVQGIEGAKAFQLTPNSNAVLMDSESNDRFFIKVADNIGMCTLREYKYEEVVEKSQSAVDLDLSKFVTRDELDEILNKRGGKNDKSAISTTTDTTSTK